MKKAGFAYESAVNGLEAVQKAESETFRAIIMGKIALFRLVDRLLTGQISPCRSWMV